MSRTINVTIDDAVASALETAAARAHQPVAEFLADQLAVALGPGRNLTARSEPPRQSRSTRRRHAKRARAERAAAREAASINSIYETTENHDH